MSAFSRARTHLVLSHPFFATLCLGLKPVEKSEEWWEMNVGQMGTAATDGKHLYYSNKFFDKIGLNAAVFVLAHEALHVGLLHPFRREGRCIICWRQATDYVINYHLVKAGFQMPQEKGKEVGLHDVRFADMSAEQVYRILHKEVDEEAQKMRAQGGQGQGSPQEGGSDPSKDGSQTAQDGSGEEQQGKGGSGAQDPSSKGSEGKGGGKEPSSQQAGDKGQGGGHVHDQLHAGCGHCSGVIDYPGDPVEGETEAKIKLTQAVALAKAQGTLPAGMDGLVEDILKPKVDWRDVLREFVKSKRKDDYSIHRPNRRLISDGIYVPSLLSYGIGPVVLVRDTSGSTADLQSQFLGECKGVFEDCRPEKLWILDVDAAVHQVHELDHWDQMPESLTKPKGYGGTDFRPAFTWVNEHDVRPECVIYLTDMYGTFPEEDPGYPVLWISSSEVKVAPFGRVVQMEVEG